MKARIHDATLAMTEDLESFIAAVGESDLKVTINGDTVNAEEALAVLVENINAEDGTVTIDGDKVPAEDALDYVLELINKGHAEVEVGANTRPAEVSVKEAKGRISRSEASIYVTADLTAAERELKEFKARLKQLGIRVSGVTSVGGAHEGGWIAKGLHAGGRVPGRDPGYDNVLWPLNSGGRTLVQPLAGGEYVVNSKDATFWGPMLEWMNGGGRPSQVFNETSNAPVYIDKVVGLTIAEVEREAATRRRRDALSPSKGA
jgi:phosphotransferase system HPr-like phosphotransfer protein